MPEDPRSEERSALRMSVAKQIMSIIKKHEVEKLTGSIVWDGFPEGSAERIALQGIIPQLGSAFDLLATDTFLAKTFAPVIREFFFEAGEPGAEVSNDRMTLRIGTEPMTPREIAEALRKALETK